MRLLVALALTFLLPATAVGQAVCEGITVTAVGTTPYRVISGADTVAQRQQVHLALVDAMRAATELGRVVNVDARWVVRCPGVQIPPVVVIPPDTVKPPVVVPPAPAEVWTRTLADTSIVGDVIVPDGQRWLIGKGVRIAGNLRTDGGLIGMRPGSYLKFEGADPSQYVGGGMTYTDAFQGDRGLWVGGTGILDISCSPKVGWTREPWHSSWLATDEVYVTPTSLGDFAPRRWTQQDSVPRFDPRVPEAEIINVTRDCTVEGPGHIHISSTVPSRIEYVTLRGMGITNPTCGTVCGRYALHLHGMGEASRGMVIRGVAAIDSKGAVFVPHASHGVTYLDNVCINGYAECFWWDKGDRSNGTTIDGLASSGTFVDRSITGNVPRNAAVVLGCGSGNSISNSAVSGVRGGNEYAAGYEWFACNRDKEPAVWEFSEGLVSHNTQGPGIRFWTNSGQPHEVENTITYNSGFAILNGAYSNAIEYTDVLSLGGGINHNTSCNTRDDGLPGARYLRPEIYARSGPAVIVDGQNLAAECVWLFEDCKALQPGPGSPVVVVNKTANPWIARFVNCGVTRRDFDISLATAGLSVEIVEGGRIIDTISK